MAKALIVDDEAPVRSILSSLLDDRGDEAHTTNSGESALQILELSAFDLVVLDMKLPGICGAQILKIIQARWPDTAVVCITGFGTIRDAVGSLQSGALDYLEKPFHSREFLIVADRALAAKKARRTPIHEVALLDSEFGAPDITGGGSPIERDLEPVTDVLRTLASFLASTDQRGRPAGNSTAAPLGFDLTLALIRAITGVSRPSPPVFWSLARGFRTLSSGATRDRRLWAEELQWALRNAAELVGQARPQTRAIVSALQTALASLGANVRVQEIAQELHVDRHYLSRLLKIDTGLTFRQWKWAILMRLASRELAASDRNVRQIAFGLGYDHPQQFDRDFSRVFGMPPVRFRELARPFGSTS